MGILLTGTSKDIEHAVVIIRVLLTAKPAPLVAAQSASHMVAPFHLFQSNLALRTITNVSVIGSPPHEVFLKRVLTFLAPMPLEPTIEANLHAAFANHFSLFASLHVMVAIRAWTPLEVRV